MKVIIDGVEYVESPTGDVAARLARLQWAVGQVTGALKNHYL